MTKRPRKPEKPEKVASRQATFRDRQREQGRERVELWLTPQERDAVRERRRTLHNATTHGENTMLFKGCAGYK